MRGEGNPNFRAAGARVCCGCGSAYSSYSKARKFCSHACYQKSGTMRGRAKKDANHNEIVAALEKCGATVRDLSHASNGVPDLLVWVREQWHLVEVKNPETGYGKRGLNERQKKWATDWRGGPVFILRTVDEAIAFARGKLDDIQTIGGDK